MSLLHEIENSQDTQSFLKQNGKKFQGDCLTVMKLLYSGLRLSGQELVVKYGLHDRRLRDCYNARPDIIRKEWKHGSDGKRQYVEYFIDQFSPPTKQITVEKALRYIKGEKNASDYARELINGAKQNLLSQTELFQ